MVSTWFKKYREHKTYFTRKVKENIPEDGLVSLLRKTLNKT